MALKDDLRSMLEVVDHSRVRREVEDGVARFRREVVDAVGHVFAKPEGPVHMKARTHLSTQSYSNRQINDVRSVVIDSKWTINNHKDELETSFYVLKFSTVFQLKHSKCNSEVLKGTLLFSDLP
jgi:hypothetical protein